MMRPAPCFVRAAPQRGAIASAAVQGEPMSHKAHALLLGLLALLPGCGTLNSGASGCFGSYSGVRQDLELLAALGARPAETDVPLGIDGALADLWDGAFVAFDLPLSFVLDTAAAPVALAVGQRRPEPTGLGCHWSRQDGGNVELPLPEPER
jgi:uncharacterized protein YceK